MRLWWDSDETPMSLQCGPMSVQWVSNEFPMSIWWVSDENDETSIRLRWDFDKTLMRLQWAFRWIFDETSMRLWQVSKLVCISFVADSIRSKSMAKKARPRNKGSSTVCVDLYYVIRVKNGWRKAKGCWWYWPPIDFRTNSIRGPNVHAWHNTTKGSTVAYLHSYIITDLFRAKTTLFSVLGQRIKSRTSKKKYDSGTDYQWSYIWPDSFFVWGKKVKTKTKQNTKFPNARLISWIFFRNCDGKK